MMKHFDHTPTYHCVTGSLRDIYGYYGHPLSEELLLGLGEGVGFIYWHQKGQPPFIGGRATPKPSLEELVGLRTGVKVTAHTTASKPRAESAMIELLKSDNPVMIQVDMGFLPYFDFQGVDYHFGGHVVVVCDYDETSRQGTIADRDEKLYRVSLDDVAKARGSTFKPFPPQNRWLTFDFSQKRQPTKDEINTAICNQADLMLNPPISNIGVKGIRKTAKLMPEWGSIMTQEELKWALFNAYIFISPVGGSGGGTFRYMFSRFLAEASDLADNPKLVACADEFCQAGDAWEEVGEWCKETSEKLPANLSPLRAMINKVADVEEHAWSHLCDAIS